MTSLAAAEQQTLTDAAEHHLHGTLPPAAMAALLPSIVIPVEQSFEAWEDGAYVLAYLRQKGLR